MSIKNFVKKNVLLSLSICLLTAVLIKIFPLNLDFSQKNISMKILKNKNNITNLYMEKDIAYENNYFINMINFKNGRELIHENFGNLGFAENFFIDFETMIEVLQEGTYNFIIYSDDGFNLKIDDNLIMEFKESRPLASNSKNIFLKKGIHNLKIAYYQGYGLLGLKAYYEDPFSSKKYYIGKNTGLMKFLKP